MDDVQQIDLVEKIKGYVQQGRPGLEDDAAAESPREKESHYFHQKFLFIILK